MLKIVSSICDTILCLKAELTGIALGVDQGHVFDISLRALWPLSGEEMFYVDPTQSESSILEAFKVAQPLYNQSGSRSCSM